MILVFLNLMDLLGGYRTGIDNVPWVLETNVFCYCWMEYSVNTLWGFEDNQIMRAEPYKRGDDILLPSEYTAISEDVCKSVK